jgi:inhibitor of cysteine peptidase
MSFAGVVRRIRQWATPVVAAALVAAACGRTETPVVPAPEPEKAAEETTGPAEEPAAAPAALPAPAATGVVRDVTLADAGATIAIKTGEKFSVSLSGVPTAGYVWMPEDLPSFLAKTDELGGPTTSAQQQPGFAGGNHWEVTVFEAKAAGEGELVMVQRRPWEDKAEPDNQRFSVKVKVE